MSIKQTEIGVYQTFRDVNKDYEYAKLNEQLHSVQTRGSDNRF